MSNLYITEARVTLRLGSREDLLDRDEDDVADTGLLADIIESAGRHINMRLKQRYGSAVPFAEITDDPDTPDEIQELALAFVMHDLYSWGEANGPDAQRWQALFDSTLERLLDGDYDIDGLARAKAHEGRDALVTDYATPIGGRDSDDVDRLRGI